MARRMLALSWMKNYVKGLMQKLRESLQSLQRLLTPPVLHRHRLQPIRTRQEKDVERWRNEGGH